MHSYFNLPRKAVALLRTAVLAVSLCAGTAAWAQSQENLPTVCVFDILGSTGPVFSIVKDFQLEGARQGYPFKPMVFTDERVAAENFKTNQCQGLVATGIRVRQFNLFTGSIDSIGALPSYDLLIDLIGVLSKPSPKLSKYMVKGRYEVAGLIPFGAAYIYVNDRAINTLAKAAGKKIASLEHDKSQAELIKQIGATPVTADLLTFGTMFNNGSVDIIAAPAVAYKPLELFKGIGKKGAIVRFPVAMLTYQVVINKDAFPPGTGEKLRAHVFSQINVAMKEVKKIEAEVPESAWMDITEAEKADYKNMMRLSRVELRKKGIYDGDMLSLMLKIRCKRAPSEGECAQSEERLD